MKLKTLINRLEKARQLYVKRYKKEPSIFIISNKEIVLCYHIYEKPEEVVCIKPHMVIKLPIFYEESEG